MVQVLSLQMETLAQPCLDQHQTKTPHSMTQPCDDRSAIDFMCKHATPVVSAHTVVAVKPHSCNSVSADTSAGCYSVIMSLAINRS